ncbi:MAG TPA: 30S ribosome-binding factor RbfA [Bacillota bacterium]|jgi:ribosome-binding factor A|nr:30S ribosome-binding factor RbfA [Bacillota bacterium]HOB87572.1 30S ribosome-binding factor RbfA [Bacillota bacterium]HOP68450.1 30S ribosome-binding factor RbfA [Bacillota bacterium]HPT33556.1 30S ribosome-binding factor RbfA [Bacillota bacterium]HPZ64878.1 30S ribosome-binding factor RbfA [Bacillota bacterium]
MSSTRARRVAEQIKKEVSQIIREVLKDPRLAGLISVTGVEISRDLRYASVYVSIFGEEEEIQGTLQVLEQATGFIRTELGQRLRLRFVPELSFRLDRSIEYGARIEEVLKKIEREQNRNE